MSWHQGWEVGNRDFNREQVENADYMSEGKEAARTGKKKEDCPNVYPSRAHCQWHGLDGLVETPAGSKRKGRGRNGRIWSVEMPCDYGELSCATGTDGDNVDCYWIGDEPIAHIVEQHDPPGSGQFDEHKILLGASQDEAVAVYCKSFSDGKGFERIGKITEVDVDGLKMFLAGRTHLAP